MNLENFPKDGRFGEYGGKYVPETLNAALTELEDAYEKSEERQKVSS